MSEICQLVPRNRNESDTLSRNILPLQHGNFGSQIIRGVDPPSLLSKYSKIDCREGEERLRKEGSFEISSSSPSSSRGSCFKCYDDDWTRIHLTAENTTATSLLLLTFRSCSPSLHSCHNDPGKNPPDNRQVSRFAMDNSADFPFLSATLSPLRRCGYPTRQRSKPKANEICQMDRRRPGAGDCFIIWRRQGFFG